MIVRDPATGEVILRAAPGQVITCEMVVGGSLRVVTIEAPELDDCPSCGAEYWEPHDRWCDRDDEPEPPPREVLRVDSPWQPPDQQGRRYGG